MKERLGGGGLAVAIVLMLVPVGGIAGHCSDGATISALTITYDLDGGQGDFPIQYYEDVRGSAYLTVPSEVPYKEGCTFLHWNVTAESWSATESLPSEVPPGYTFVASGGNYNILTLTAVWTSDVSDLVFLTDPVTDGIVSYIGIVYHTVTIDHPTDGTFTIRVAHGECVPYEYIPSDIDGRLVIWRQDDYTRFYDDTPVTGDMRIWGEITNTGGSSN